MGDDQPERGGTGTERPVPGRNPADVQHVSAEWAAEVVREAIRRVAPRELAVFDTVADAWLTVGEQPRRLRRRPGATVGFGVDSVLLSELAFPVITGAVGEVLGNVVWERVRPRRRLGRPRAAPQVTAPVGSAAEASAAEAGAAEASAAREDAAEVGDRAGPGVEFTEQQIRDLRDACRRHGITLGLPADTAELLADAVVGALHSAPAGP